MKTDGSEINYPLRYYPVCESGEIYSGPGVWSVLRCVGWNVNCSLPFSELPYPLRPTPSRALRNRSLLPCFLLGELHPATAVSGSFST
jgi:hypothetical protein